MGWHGMGFEYVDFNAIHLMSLFSYTHYLIQTLVQLVGDMVA